MKQSLVNPWMVFLLLKSNFSSNNFTIDLEKCFSLDLSNVKIKLSWPSLKFTGSNRTVNPCMRQPTAQTPTPLLQLYLSQFLLSETKWYLKLRNRRNSLYFKFVWNDIGTLSIELTCIYGTERRFLRSYCIHQDGMVH